MFRYRSTLMTRPDVQQAIIMAKIRKITGSLISKIAALGDDPSERYSAGGKQIRCLHCGHDKFETREMLMNTTGATLLNLDWLNAAATALVCKKCSRIELFNEPPKELKE